MRRWGRSWGWIVRILAAAAAATAAGSPGAGEISPELFSALELRHIGPLGNRVIAVAGVSGDANVYYAGAASGGIFKTVDGGAHWQPVFDDQPVSSIGALAVAPSDPNVVWAGTGETFLRANVSIGNGIYRSQDAGKTWKHMGLDATGRIGRVIVHPTDPRIVYAAALGHCYGPQPERGVFRTTDGGETWERVLFSGENAGASDLVMDPTNPRILFAGLWQMRIDTWGRESGGGESGLHVSRDGGDTWTELTGHGLPERPWGKIGLTMSAADPRRVYALIETSSNRDFAPVDEFQGVLWRSDDGGESWKMVSADNELAQRPLYYSRALAAPDDADEVHFMAVRHHRSRDGGVTSSAENQAGWDHHDMWIDPAAPARMIVGYDGGVAISTTRGKSWFRPQLPSAQMYHAHVDDAVPYFVYGNRQDGAALRGPSNTLTGDDIPIGAWHSVGGCEVGFAVPSPADRQVVWAGCYDGVLERYDGRTGHARDVSVRPLAVESWPAIELEFRFHWTFPVAISPHDGARVYVGSQYVHLSVDEGQSWRVISPDLTTDDPEMQRRKGGLTLDDAGPTVGPSIFALGLSPLAEDEIWAGTNDGQVQLTRDGGATWVNLTANLPEPPPRGTISNIEPSRHAAGTAYLTVDRHQLGDTATYVYRTADWGASWRHIASGVPPSVVSYAHCVREDPVRPGLLYLGVENGLYVSFTDGERWLPFESNLPPAPVHWLAVQEHFNDLVVATYGRGFWILDDLTPLQRLDPQALAAGPVLFDPRPAYRFRRREAPMMQPEDPAAGKNPPYGASLHFYVPDGVDDSGGTGERDKSDGTDETEHVKLTVLDASGAVVRTLDEVPQDAGLQRVFWDLEYDATRQVKLRTRPAENPHVTLPEEGWRELVDGGRLSVLAPPGVYTVQLEVGEAILRRELTVRRDPGSAGSDEDLEAQMERVLRLRDMVNEAAGMINEIEWARRGILDLEARLAAFEPPPAETDEILVAAAALSHELEAREGRFFDLRMTQASQDNLRWKRLLYARLIYLARSLMRADAAPTEAQLEVFEQLSEELAASRERFSELRAQDVPAFNQRLRESGVGHVILGAASSRPPVSSRPR